MLFYLRRIMLRIRLIDKENVGAVNDFCCNSLLGTRILCYVNAYGIERNFLSVWCCTDENDSVCAVICKFEGSITLLSDKDIDMQEVRAFLDMVGFDSLCCSYEAAIRLNYQDIISKKAYIFDGNFDGEALSGLSEDYYKKCYSLICNNIPDSFVDSDEAYLHFLSDFVYRKNRGLARIKGLAENERVISCALTGSETEKSAIISGVACDADCRRKGLGKRTVLSLAAELKNEGKTVYVIALNESAQGFYEHIGFSFYEKISFIERK